MDLSIGELAALSGEGVKTLRFWTDEGLLRASRGENNYRRYSLEASQRVAFIRSAQALGLSLEAVRRLLALGDSELQPCEDVRDELSAHLRDVRARIAFLRSIERALENELEQARVSPCGASGCRFLPQPVPGRGP